MNIPQIIPQAKLDAVRNDLSEVLDKHGINNELGATMLLIAGAYFGPSLGKVAAALSSGAELAFTMAAKHVVQQNDET